MDVSSNLLERQQQHNSQLTYNPIPSPMGLHPQHHLSSTLPLTLPLTPTPDHSMMAPPVSTPSSMCESPSSTTEVKPQISQLTQNWSPYSSIPPPQPPHHADLSSILGHPCGYPPAYAPLPGSNGGLMLGPLPGHHLGRPIPEPSYQCTDFMTSPLCTIPQQQPQPTSLMPQLQLNPLNGLGSPVTQRTFPFYPDVPLMGPVNTYSGLDYGQSNTLPAIPRYDADIGQAYSSSDSANNHTSAG